MAEHEVVTLTTYIINLSLTDSWKGTTRHFLSHFEEKLRLLDSLVPDTDKIPETVRFTFLQGLSIRTMISGRSMFLILCGDPKQVPLESLFLKSIITCFGMQPTNVISTMLHSKNKGKLSFPIKLAHLMNANMILEKIPHLIQMRMIHPHTQFFNPLSTLLNHKNLPRFYSQPTLGRTS